MSSIDPRQAAFRAAEEARRRAAEEARRRAAERAREEARARELGQRLRSALESRGGTDPRQVAGILGEAESLGPEARERFTAEAGPQATRVAGGRPRAELTEALRARIAEVFPEGSDGRRRLGEALASVRGDDPRGLSREALESLVSETLSRLAASPTAPRPARSVGGTTRDVLEQAPNVSLFGGGFRAAGGVAREADAETGTRLREWHGEAVRSEQARPKVSADPNAFVDRSGPRITGGVSSERTTPSPVQSAAAEVPPQRSPATTPDVSPELTRASSPPPPAAARLPERPLRAETARARAADVALDREELAAALGQPPVRERATSPITSTDAARVTAAEAPPIEAARAPEIREGFFTKVRQALIRTPSVAEAVIAPGLRSAGGSIESAARSLARAREALSDGSHENVRVQYGLGQARGFFEKIASRLEGTRRLVAREIVPGRIATLRVGATAARGELRAVRLDADRASVELGEITGWAKQVGVRSVLRDVADLSRAARRGEGELRLVGGRAAVLESLQAGAAAEEGVRESDGGGGIPPNRLGGEPAPPDLADAARPAGIPEDFTFGEEDLARIGSGLDPTRPPPQNYWNEELVNTLCDLGRQQGGVTDADGHAHSLLAGQLLEGAEGQAIELGAAEIAVALKAARIPLEKVDPNQLASAARYINTATGASDQQEKLRKTLDNFQVLTTIGAPSLTRHQMSEQLWAIARVPGHALENLSDTELRAKYQEILTAVNSGPGGVELKVGKHNLKFTVGETGQVTDSETKKPGLLSRIGGFFKKVAPIALTVASFIPLTAPFARIAQGAISLVKAVRSKSLLGAVTSAAGMVAGGATALAGRMASGAASTAAQVARIANGAARGLQGFSSIRQGSVLGGIAALGSGVADAIGRAAEGTATGLQRFANRLGDTSAKLSYAARGIGVVDGYRAASRAVNEARVLLRQAEASGDAAAIAAAREQLAAAEKAKTSALLGGAASAAGLAADVRADHAVFAGDAVNSPIPQAGLDQLLRGASRGLGLAHGVQSGDLASAGVSALGLAAVGRAATGGESPDTLGLNDAANLADAGLAYHQANAATAAADQAVADAEAALEAARASGDAVAVQQAQANLDGARRAREGALMGAIGAGDGLVLTAAQIGEKLETVREAKRIEAATAQLQAALEKEHDRALATMEEADEQERTWLAQVRDESLSPQGREAAAAGILALRRAKEVYDAAIEEASGDPEKLHAATVAFEDLQARIETEVANRASVSAFAAQQAAVDAEIESIRETIAETREEMNRLRTLASDPNADPQERLLAAKRVEVLGQAVSVMGQVLALPGTDPERLRQGHAVFLDHREFVLTADLDTRDLAATGTSAPYSAPEPNAAAASGSPGAAGIAVLSKNGTLSHIAAMTGIPVERLLEFNARYGIDLHDTTHLPIGQRVLVPMDEVQPQITVPRLTAQERLVRQELGLPLDFPLGMDIRPGESEPPPLLSDASEPTGFFDEGRALVDGVRDVYNEHLAELTRSIVDAGRGGPITFLGTLPLYALDESVNFSAGVAQGLLNTAEGVTDMVGHPVDTTLGVASLIDRAAQTTPAGRTFEFLAEAAFGKYGSTEEALRAYRERMDPLSMGAAQYALARDLTAAQFEQSLRLAREGRYSEALGVLYGENADVFVAGILGRGGRLARLGDLADDADDLVRLRRLYGEGPEADSLRIVDRRQARLSGIRQHHVFPQEHRTFFEERGFVGDRDIDRFCVEIDQATHEAIHGGGDWRLGREAWEDEWNRKIVREVLARERRIGRTLNFDEVLEVGLDLLEESGLPTELLRYKRKP